MTRSASLECAASCGSRFCLRYVAGSAKVSECAKITGYDAAHVLCTPSAGDSVEVLEAALVRRNRALHRKHGTRLRVRARGHAVVVLDPHVARAVNMDPAIDHRRDPRVSACRGST